MKLRLEHKEIEGISEHMKRVMFFDPSQLYSRFQRLPKNRYQAHISSEVLFPSIPGLCACGCGKPLTGRRRRWATKECNNFAVSVYYIIRGDTRTIFSYLTNYYGYKCSKCPETIDLHVDHILAVTNGGGGLWLSNYQLLCKSCHKEKTRLDLHYELHQTFKEIFV